MNSNLLSSYSKYQLILFPIIVGIISLVIAQQIIFPQINKYIKGQEDVKRLNDRVLRLGDKSKALEALDTSGLTEKVETAVRALPPDKDLANLIGLLQSEAAENHVVLVSVNLGQATGSKTDKFNPFTVRLEIGGGLQDFKKFINSIEKSARVMKVVTVEVAPEAASASASANTVVELYFAPTPNEIGAVDAPIPTISQKEEELLTSLAEQSIAIPGAGDVDTTQVPLGKPNPFQ